MIKIENVEVTGWEATIRGMRNPLNSWDKSDTDYADYRDTGCDLNYLTLGENDLGLMSKLSDAGNDHGKFLRFITVTLDVIAPLYWWKEYDTYKVGTVANSCSTMHTIHKKPLSMDDFSHEHLDPLNMEVMRSQVGVLNLYAEKYRNTGDKEAWWQIIQMLPTSFNQRRTLQLNYAVLKAMYLSRKNHKLDEWHVFCDWIEGLPYAKELIIGGTE